MKPKDVIEILSRGKLGKSGRLLEALGAYDDYLAGKVLKHLTEHVLPEKATTRDAINVLTEAIWWILLFAPIESEEAPDEGVRPD